jgi:hypothetical protein
LNTDAVNVNYTTLKVTENYFSDDKATLVKVYDGLVNRQTKYGDNKFHVKHAENWRFMGVIYLFIADLI